MTCFRLVHVRFFRGFPVFVIDNFVDCFKEAAVGIAVVAGMLDDVVKSLCEREGCI